MLPNKELSKELRELSGWDGEFTLGYLLRKLPASLEYKDETLKMPGLIMRKKIGLSSGWLIGYEYAGVFAMADTPEDAAAKLCCELIRQEVLKP